eukprot:s5547_g3.t1
MNSKNQFDLATKEVIAFCQTLGYSSVQLRCDNEPSVLQLQRLILETRQRMGLQTQATTPSAYQHGNALAENAVQRIRGLAGSLMHSLQLKLGGVVISSNHALWTWSMRHAAWLLNRFNPHQGLTPFEVVYGKPYDGQICEYGEPVLGFSRTMMKGNPKWRRMLFLGKVEAQDSFLLFDGTSLVLTRSVRRVKSNWVVHMAFFKELNLYPWQYKVGFGGRVIPTKRKVTPKAVTFVPPIGPVEPSKLVDEDAEAVKAKAQEEKREEEELARMTGFDKPGEIQRDVKFGDGRTFADEPAEAVAPVLPAAPVGPSSMMGLAPSPSLMPSSTTPQTKFGLDVPQTPQDLGAAASSSTSPRHSSTTRTHAVEAEETETKKARTEDHKKQRIERLAAEQEKMIRTIRFGSEEYFTLDSYDAEPVEESPDLETEDLCGPMRNNSILLEWMKSYGATTT